MQGEPHLSVVATSRNDNHGGFLTPRMQHFVDGLAAQCRRHGLRAELVLVEWNPPAGRRPLAEELVWPAAGGPCEIRIVTVPRETHAKLAHADKLPLYQMIAKNVGIRRARGRFVLATNIDILFSDEVMRAMRDQLRTGHLYRVDRRDVPTAVPAGVDFDAVLEFCRREEFRLNATGFTLLKRDGRWQPGTPLAALLQTIWNAVGRALRRARERLRQPSASMAPLSQAAPRAVRGKLELLAWSAQWIYHGLIRRELFTNACGDFTLLSRDDWFALRGYPEWPVYSMHLDSMLLYQAHRSAIREVYLGAAAPIYHIEHSPGSGFTPESSDKLFERLAAAGIPTLDWKRDLEPMIAKMGAGPKPVRYNDENWGYAGETFAEVRVA
ncbi:MAG TPA: hypothetical protein VF943_15155 [Burkholderiales bacterium]